MQPPKAQRRHGAEGGPFQSILMRIQFRGEWEAKSTLDSLIGVIQPGGKRELCMVNLSSKFQRSTRYIEWSMLGYTEKGGVLIERGARGNTAAWPSSGPGYAVQPYATWPVPTTERPEPATEAQADLNSKFPRMLGRIQKAGSLETFDNLCTAHRDKPRPRIRVSGNFPEMAAVAPDCTNWSLAVLRHASSILPAALARWWPKLPEATHAVTACQSLVSNHHLSFECRSAETHPQPGRSPKCYGAPPAFLFVSHE